MKHARLALILAMTLLVAVPVRAASLTMLQFGSFESREEAEKRLAELNTKHAKALKSLPSSVREIALSPENLTVYRAQAGPIADRKAAQDVCAALASGGDECYIVNTAMVVAEDLPAAAIAQAQAVSVVEPKSDVAPAMKAAQKAPAPTLLAEAKPVTPAPLVEAKVVQKAEPQQAQIEHVASEVISVDKADIQPEKKVEKTALDSEAEHQQAPKVEVPVVVSDTGKSRPSVFDTMVAPVEKPVAPLVAAAEVTAVTPTMPSSPAKGAAPSVPTSAKLAASAKQVVNKPVVASASSKKFTMAVAPESSRVASAEPQAAELMGGQPSFENAPDTMMVLPPPPAPLPPRASVTKVEEKPVVAKALVVEPPSDKKLVEAKNKQPAPFIAVLDPSPVSAPEPTPQAAVSAPEGTGFWSRFNIFEDKPSAGASPRDAAPESLMADAHPPAAASTPLAPMPAVAEVPSMQLPPPPAPSLARADSSNAGPVLQASPALPVEQARLLPIPAGDMVARPESKPVSHISVAPVAPVMPVPSTSSPSLAPVVPTVVDVPAAPPVLPAPPPPPVAAPNAGVKVEEAKRVPLSDMPPPPSPISSSPVPAPARYTPAPVAVAQRPLQPPISMSPSAGEGTKTVWAQIGPFADATSAYAFWTNYRQAHPDFPVVRARVVVGYQQKMHGVNQSYLRIGPVARKGFVSYLCSAVTPESQLQCGVITDLGLASAMDTADDAFQSQRYVHSAP